MSAKPVTGNEAFLAACIKHSAEKIKIDFDSLASDIGMSVGGARNKYNAIMKAINEERGGDGTAPAAKAPAKKTAAKRKPAGAKGTKKTAQDDEAEAQESSLSEAESPKKKVKMVKQVKKEEEDEGAEEA